MPPLYGSQAQGTVTHDSVLSNRVVIDMSEVIKRADPNIAPFTLIASRLPFEEAFAEKFEWMQADDFDATVEVAAAAAADAATLVVIAGDFNKITKNHLIRNLRTDEVFLVTATPTTTSIAVKSNDGTGTGGSAVNAGDQFLILSTAMEYSSLPVDQVTLEPAADFNFVQTRRRGWKVAGRIQASRLYGPRALEFAEQSNVREFLKENERVYLLGNRSRTLVGANTIGTITTTGGVRQFMDNAGSKTFVRDFNNVAFTKSEWDSFLREAFLFGSDQKLMICGWNIMAVIDDFANEKLRTVQGAKEFGITIRRYESTYGIVDIMPHRAWNLEWGMRNEAWIVDLNNLKRRGLPGRSQVMLTTRTSGGGNDLQAAGEDAIHQEIMVEDGLEARHLETFARATNILVTS